MAATESIVAPATPHGESALALVRINGPLARLLAVELRRSHPLESHRVWIGDYVDRCGTSLDQAAFCHFAAPRSYTGDDVLEISCHGNPLIVSRIVEDVCARGGRLAEPGEFTKRAFLNRRLDLAQAEAVIDIIRARSDRALAAAQRQLRGALGRRLESILERLLALSAAVEAYIDFPEEDLPADDSIARQAEINALLDELRRLAATKRQGELVRNGIRVVLIGEPNCGKSSLFNQLAGYERAIVSPTPGTTRDYLEERFILGRHCIILLDTAGLACATDDPVERAGVQRTIECARSADVLLVVEDVTRPTPPFPDVIQDCLRSVPVVGVLNKIDLPAYVGPHTFPPECPLAEVSALSGAGIDRLRARLTGVLDGLCGSDGSRESADLYVNARHAEAIDHTVEALQRAAFVLGSSQALELVASELRHAFTALGAVTGTVDSDGVLDRLFSRFCIGK
jgi:tRNA modification GTPase